MEKRNQTGDEVRRRLVERCATDADLRRRILRDPKTTVEQEMGLSLPDEIDIRVVEETPQTVYLVLPAPAAGLGASELSEAELEGVAGGWSQTGHHTCGQQTCNINEISECECEASA